MLSPHTDLAGTVSDAMDGLGIAGAIPAVTLVPMLPGARMVGPARTVRNIIQSTPPAVGARERRSRQADIEARNRDVAVSVVEIATRPHFRKIGGS